MDTAKVFMTGKSQAVRLPKKFRFDVDEVAISQLGDALIMAPKGSVWNIFMNSLDEFTDDIFQDGRDQGVPEDRQPL